MHNILRPSTVTVYNQMGQAVVTYNTTQENETMDLQSLANGIYFVKVVSDKNI